MEIKSFSLPNYNYNLNYRHSNCSLFVQQQRRSPQRLIPLTEEIVRTMVDLNTTPSNTSISDKQLYNALSVTSLVREEVHNVLQELSISEKYIRKEEIDDLVEKCLKKKTTIIQDNAFSFDEDLSEEIDEISGISNEKNKLIIENFQILEQRITDVEKRLSGMMYRNPKLRAHQFKINTTFIKDEICCLLEKIQVESNKTNNSVVIAPPFQSFELLSVDDLKDNETPINSDDIIYYERRENLYNLLNYKKSLPTLSLNEKVYFNPYVKPILRTLPDYRHKIKQRTTFIENNL